MTVAWVITREGPNHPREVIGILSKRKSAHIKEYLEWLCALLHYDPSEHLAFSRYNNPVRPYKAQFGTVDHHMVWCGDMIARLGRNISLIESCGEKSVLKWQNPDRRNFDQQTPPNIVEKILGAICEAPIHLPLRIMSDDTPLKVAVKDTNSSKKVSAPFDLEQFDLEKTVLDVVKLREDRRRLSTLQVEEHPRCSEPKSTA